MAQGNLIHSHYAQYLGLETLFGLQGEINDLNHPEEFLFRSVHLVSELWLRLVETDMQRITAALIEREWLLAMRLLHRCNSTMNLLVTQLGLLETMLVADYNAFRGALGNASGLQSPGYSALRSGAKPLAAAFNTAQEQHPDDTSLAELRESLVSFDLATQRFLMGHWQIARRFVGDGGAGTGGQGVDYLRGGIERSLFPTLWQATT